MPDEGKKAGPTHQNAFTLVGSLGAVVTSPIVAGIFLGVFLDGKFGGGGIFIVGGIVLGIVAGLLAAYKMLVPYTRQP